MSTALSSTNASGIAAGDGGVGIATGGVAAFFALLAGFAAPFVAGFAAAFAGLAAALFAGFAVDAFVGFATALAGFAAPFFVGFAALLVFFVGFAAAGFARPDVLPRVIFAFAPMGRIIPAIGRNRRRDDDPGRSR
jgi:hypothetical protein